MDEIVGNDEISAVRAESGVMPSRAQVSAVEAHLRQMPQVEMPTTDHFSEGVYGREIFIPAGTIIVGKIHKYESLNVLLSGEIAVLTNDGMRRLTPPFIEVSPPGTKRIAYALTDVRWLTVHGTHERDVAVIEQQFIAQDEQEFLAFCEQQKLLKGE
ncbi:hypothetical protein IP92_05750 [Pseudoduganella flava]|uniref:Cyclic nucleotide-binding domain-containing protein n=1 Tax=Pseudoduganella flava TaxID=871742 RepID=A0A562P9Y3_9BURK|nr:hypothetical protein [Pseudoduganella flava]QGZ42717.1 hypothetical protein GO485_29240 [Pseudoduganella flava]TWI41030.1 hypothetical protein IP92_05750 [Pseudoduganella flava]